MAVDSGLERTYPYACMQMMHPKQAGLMGQEITWGEARQHIQEHLEAHLKDADGLVHMSKM